MEPKVSSGAKGRSRQKLPLKDLVDDMSIVF